MQVSHGAIQFMVYEELKLFLGRGGSEPRQLTTAEITSVGAVSKLVATLSTYPFSVSSSDSRAHSPPWRPAVLFRCCNRMRSARTLSMSGGQQLQYSLSAQERGNSDSTTLSHLRSVLCSASSAERRG